MFRKVVALLGMLLCMLNLAGGVTAQDVQITPIHYFFLNG